MKKLPLLDGRGDLKVIFISKKTQTQKKKKRRKMFENERKKEEKAKTC